MRIIKIAILAALACAAFALAASAQPLPAPGAKVWRDADLQRPLPLLGRQATPEQLQGLKRRAELPTPPYGGQGGPSVTISAPSQPLPLPPPSWQEPPGRLYAEQPLYPYVVILQSARPLWTNRPLHRRGRR